MDAVRIFDCKHYAVHDGPGIRTTFFLMGCPLRCLWCQNPESWNDETVITFTPSKCISCGQCRKVCSNLDDTLRISRQSCTLCGKCVQTCHSGARKFGSQWYTPEQIVEKVLPEKIFYEASGGGVTFSGGECLLHSKFLAKTLRRLQQQGIHTAIDTCGAVGLQNVLDVLPHTDLFLYDLKKMDAELHQKYTGMDNCQTLQNLEMLCDRGANIILRVPLIPGYTDSAEDIHAIGAYIRDVLRHRIVRCELLPYNKLAGSKYENKTIWNDHTLGSYSLADVKTQTTGYIGTLKDILLSYGVQVYVESI